MATAKAEGTSGRDHYNAIYESELEAEARWLRFGALEKANSIEQLLKQRNIKPRSVLELGCGTGAVIMECQRRNLGSEFAAIDYSKEAIRYLETHSTGISCLAADITDPAFSLEQDFDLVIASHVLEHLEKPGEFLASMMSKVRFRYLIVEVPLEDLWGIRLLNRFRDRARNLAGHVQFFTETDFDRLITSAKLEVQARRRYVPVASREILDLLQEKDGLSSFRALAARWARRYLPKILRPLWAAFYYAHYAVLCSPRAQKAERARVQAT